MYQGQVLKRHIRAAAALQDIYGDTAIADAVGVQRGAVRGWWAGSKPKPPTLRAIAKVTGLSTDELTRFVYYEGPTLTLPKLDIIRDVAGGQLPDTSPLADPDPPDSE